MKKKGKIIVEEKDLKGMLFEFLVHAAFAPQVAHLISIARQSEQGFGSILDSVKKQSGMDFSRYGKLIYISLVWNAAFNWRYVVELQVKYLLAKTNGEYAKTHFFEELFKEFSPEQSDKLKLYFDEFSKMRGAPESVKEYFISDFNVALRESDLMYNKYKFLKSEDIGNKDLIIFFANIANVLHLLFSALGYLMPREAEKYDFNIDLK